MNNERRTRLWIVAAAVVAVVICLLIAGLIYSFQRTRTFNTRPLVLIHKPLNRDEVELGEGVMIHANSRSQRGVVRLELWVDNELVIARDTNGQAASSLTLTKGWFPTAEGTHLILVKAITKDGVEGQSSIGIIAVDNGVAGGTIHTVEEGETLASIAEEYGTTPEDIEDINPDLGPGGPAPGESLEIPDDEPGGTGEGEAPPPSEDDEDPPGAESESPSDEGVVQEAADWFGQPEEGMVGLQIEFPELRTDKGLEELHCYIGFAGSPPIWYPDADTDQTTDETFAILEEHASYTSWDVAPFLVGVGTTPVIFWPENEPITFDISCVGVTGGGTEALNLGHEEISIGSHSWNGMIIGVNVTGPDGDFEIRFRVSTVGDRPRGVPMFLDPDMTSPTNVRIDDRRISLRWDYEPEADEEPIDGFRVYLNGNLQWVELADDRESGLPYEWLLPPCDSTYTFGVTAFRYGFPDGPESFPDVTMINTPADECNREILINFLALETFNLGGDGRYEDRDGDVGPPYGWFIANDRSFSFDARTLVPSTWGALDLMRGLYHNTMYDIPEMVADSSWGYRGGPSLSVDIPPGGTFEFGFDIWDGDTGRCRDSDDRGCDDPICAGMLVIYEDNTIGILDHFHEGAIDSENGRCRVYYSFGPAPGSQVGTGSEGEEPLPWIQVEDINIDGRTGAVQIEVRNTGRATWPWRDLEVQLVRRDGPIPITTVTFPEYVLEAGQRDVLEHPDLLLTNLPYDACVVIDPNDQVLEEYERSGMMVHNPVCPEMPDLEITDVFFNAANRELQVVVRNSGDGAIESQRIVLHVLLPDGTPLEIGGSYPHTFMVPGEQRVLPVYRVTDTVRQQMAQGYSVVVNPERLFVESAYENNSYEVPEAQRLWLYLSTLHAPERYADDVVYHMDAYVTSGTAVRQVADWGIGPVDWGSCFPDEYCVKVFYDGEYETWWFDIYGDEYLEINASALHPGTLMDEMSGISVFGPGTNWGSHPAFNSSCNPSYDGFEDIQAWFLGSTASGEPWTIQYNLCREEAEE